MQNLMPLDIEDALRVDLTTAAELGGFSCAFGAPPTPKNLGDVLPYARIERLGGRRDSLVVDLHDVAIDVWADTWAEAQEAANKVVALLCGLPYADGELAHDYLGADLNALPYNNPDPQHEDLPRVSFNATVTARAVLTD